MNLNSLTLIKGGHLKWLECDDTSNNRRYDY